MSESLKQKSIKGVLWSFCGRFCIQAVQFIISIVLARLLSPEDYGVVGLAYVAIALVECFANLGIGGAVIQKKEVDELDYNTCFWAELFVRLLVFGIIYIAAPYFARYYERPILTKLIRVIVVSGLLGVVNSIPNLKLTRAMDFKTTSWIGVVSTLISSILAVIAAFRGLGMWALVIQNVVGTFVSVPLMLWKVPWCPRMQFSFQRFCHFINFGYKLLFSGILDTIYNNISSLIVGKAFSVESLGFYSKGKKLPNMVMNSVNGPINGVAFPMFSKLQGDAEKNKAALRQALRTSIFFVAPIMVGLAITAEPVVFILFGEKWLPAVPFMRIMAICYIFYPVHTLNLGAIMGKGRTDIFLKLEIIKKIYGIALMFAFIPLGLFWFVSSHLIGTILGILTNTLPMKKLLGYSTWEQIRDISISLLGSVVMAMVLVPLCFLSIREEVLIAIQLPLGALTYCLYYYLFERKTLVDNWMLFRKGILKKS